jgi:cobalamin biosynthesis protein CobT
MEVDEKTIQGEVADMLGDTEAADAASQEQEDSTKLQKPGASDDQASTADTGSDDDGEDAEGEGEDTEGEDTEGADDEDAAKSELELLREQNKAMQEQLGTLAAKIQELAAQKEAKPPETEEELKLEPVEFVPEDIDVDEIVEEPKKLNDLLNQVYQRAIVEASKKIHEKVMLTIPEIVNVHYQNLASLQAVADKFYQDNPDLNQPSIRQFVANVVTEMHSEHPDKPLPDLLSEAASEVRRRLKLMTKKTPAFAPGSRGKTDRSSQISSLEKEIAELLS